MGAAWRSSTGTQLTSGRSGGSAAESRAMNSSGATSLSSGTSITSRFPAMPRDSGAAIGDMILTSGGNIFPKGLKIGTIKEIRQEDHGVSLYAVVEPFASVNDAKDVFVITSFEGQGILIGEDLGQTGEKQSESSADSNAAEEDSSSVEAGQ